MWSQLKDRGFQSQYELCGFAKAGFIVPRGINSYKGLELSTDHSPHRADKETEAERLRDLPWVTPCDLDWSLTGIYLFKKIFIYLFGCTGSQLQHTGASVFVAGSLVERWKWILLGRVRLFATPWTIHSLWGSSGQNTGVGSLSLLQGIFPTQEMIPHLLCFLHGKMDSLTLSYQGNLLTTHRWTQMLGFFNPRPSLKFHGLGK